MQVYFFFFLPKFYNSRLPLRLSVIDFALCTETKRAFRTRAAPLREARRPGEHDGYDGKTIRTAEEQGFRLYTV